MDSGCAGMLRLVQDLFETESWRDDYAHVHDTSAMERQDHLWADKRQRANTGHEEEVVYCLDGAVAVWSTRLCLCFW